MLLLVLPLCLACAPDDVERVDLATFMATEKALYTEGAANALGAGAGELLIRYFFRDHDDGFYVDVGCSDPRANSTTYYLEEHQGWSGIGIDPLEHLGPRWETHRPRSKFFAYAVTDTSGESITLFAAGALSATAADTTNLKKWEEWKEFKAKEIEVPTITLDDLLDREGVATIDLLSMDVNGAEPVALAGFDIERFAPKLVHVEAAPHRQEELAAYFAARRYVHLEEYAKYDFSNWYFVPEP